jgi:GNAT superfamily N-acetyltransferase
MSLEVRAMSAADLDAAAGLLADRHRSDRARTPALSPRFDASDAVRPELEEALRQPLTQGMVATRSGVLEGFLIGAVTLLPPTAFYAGFLPPRSGQISYAGYAASGAEPSDVYRAMYAALAPHFLAHGAYAHMIEINAGDETALDAWFPLGFGEIFTLAVRDTSTVAGEDSAAGADVEMHLAGTEDIEVVMKLADDLARHHNGSPVFMPYLPETVPAFRDYQLKLLENSANAHWVAYRDGRPLGMQTFHAQDFAELARPDRSVYLFSGVTAPDVRGGGVGTALLRHSMEWAREAGYERCTLHFFSANLSGARFWLGNGFQPLTRRMVRHVDERIAWARGGQ